MSEQPGVRLARLVLEIEAAKKERKDQAKELGDRIAELEAQRDELARELRDGQMNLFPPLEPQEADASTEDSPISDLLAANEASWPSQNAPGESPAGAGIYETAGEGDSDTPGAPKAPAGAQPVTSDGEPVSSTLGKLDSPFERGRAAGLAGLMADAVAKDYPLGSPERIEALKGWYAGEDEAQR